MIAFDTETYRIEPGALAPKPVCLTVYRPGVGEPQIYIGDDMRTEYLKLLNSGQILVSCNLAYDAGVLTHHFPDTLAATWDAYQDDRMRCLYIHDVMSKIADGSFQRLYSCRKLRTSLAAQVWDHLGERVDGKGDDSWRLNYDQLDGVPLTEWPQGALDYALLDAEYHYRLARKRGLPDAAYPDELTQTLHHFSLHLSAVRGLMTDEESVTQLDESLHARVAKANEVLVVDGYKEPKKKSEPDGALKLNTKVVLAEVKRQYDALGWATPLTPTGNPRRDKGTLKELPCTGAQCHDGKWCDNPLHVLSTISEDEGELSKYVKWLKQGFDKPVTPRITPLVATGRCAYSQPPLQQLPRRPGVRECFIPRPGHVFIGADYKSHELVTFAQVLIWLFGSSTLADEINAGIDPLLAGAADRMGISYEEAARLLDDGDPEVAEERRTQKAPEYGYPGGLGTATMVTYAKQTFGVDMSEGESRRYKYGWQQRRPNTYAWFDYISDITASGEATIEQPFSGRMRGGCYFTNACNTHFQGLAADMAKAAFTRVTEECLLVPISPLYGSHPVLLMHDEIICESPTSGAPEAAERLSKVMELEGNRICPDVKSTADPYMMTRWYKKAEGVRNSSGRLKVWK